MNIRLGKIKLEIDYFGALIISLMLTVDRLGIMLPMLIACSLHEMGHIAAILLTKGKISSIKLCPWGIQISAPQTENERPNLTVALSGPTVNLLLWWIFKSINPQFALVQLICGGFNLLPCDGLDGGDAVHAAIQMISNEKCADFALIILSATVGLVCVLFGGVIAFKIKNPSLFVAGIYLISIQLLKKLRCRKDCA